MNTVLSFARAHWFLCGFWSLHGKDGRESQADDGLLQRSQ